jgi:hypothetical protein
MELQPKNAGSVRSVEEYVPRDIDLDEQLEELGLEKPPEGIHPLDTEPVRKRFAKVSSWFAQERARQVEFRMESMLDHEFYDGPGQWTQEEKNILAQRSQQPITLNQIKPTVDWVTGTEKKVRVDYRVLPREAEHAKAAESKTKLFKYISDANNAGYKRSKSFADAVLAGVGWIDHGISSDPDDEPLRVTYEDWRYVWWDTLSVEDDLSDARYIFRGKWVDLDVAIAMFPDRSDVIKASVIQGSLGLGYETYLESADPSFDPKMAGGMPYNAAAGNTLQYTGFFGYVGAQVAVEPRDRVFLIECQYRMPATKKMLRGKRLGPLNGITFCPECAEHQALIELGLANPVESTIMEVRQMIFTGDSVLQDGESPYRHKRFSLVPIWGFKRKKDGTPYGIVRNLRDPQKDLNKRRSKALYLLSANRVIADDDAINDTDQNWSDIVREANRPDGLIKQNPKSQRGIEIQTENKMAEEHVMLMAQDEKYIQSASGVTDELMGRDTNAVSGKAIRARQEQGGVTTGLFFDNARLAFKLSGEIILSMIEQLYTEEKNVRITGGENGQNAEFLAINTIDPETGETIGDITASQADFVISEQDYSGTIRQAMFDSLTDMIKTMDPNAAMQILDLVFEMSDLPGKEKFVDRLRAITGNRGSESVPTPEQLAQDQAKAAEAQAQAQAQNDILMTQLENEKAKVLKLQQEAQLIAAKIRTESVTQQVRAAGVDYDQEKLRIEKASALNAIEQAEHQREMDKAQPGASPEAAAQDMAIRERQTQIEEARASSDIAVKETQAQHDMAMKEDAQAHMKQHEADLAEHQKTLQTEDQAHRHKLEEKDHEVKAKAISDRSEMIKHEATKGRAVERGLKSNNRD